MDLANHINILTYIDFVGQAKAERIYRFIITVFAVVGLLWGAIIQQFSHTVLILSAGLLFAAILTLPPWAFYRRKPLNWQKEKTSSVAKQK